MATFLHENTAAAPVVRGKRFVIGNIYCSLCSNHAVGTAVVTAADTKAAALAILGAVSGNGAAAHGKLDSTRPVIVARINAAPCQSGKVAGDIAAGHLHGRTVRQSNTAAAVGVVRIGRATCTITTLRVVGHITVAGQSQCSAVDIDTGTIVVVSIDDLVARHRTAGDGQLSAYDVDTAAEIATVGRNNTALDIHRTFLRTAADVDTAAGLVVTAAAHNIAARHVQRSVLHIDNMSDAGALEYTAL